MAKKKKVTSHNTGLSIARNGTKFTASWKIKAEKVDLQKIRYRVHNGFTWSGWTEKSIGVKKTSYSISLNDYTTKRYFKVQFQTRVRREDTSKTNYTVSSYDDSSSVYTIHAPATPSLSVTNNNANKTTFTWSVANDSTSATWFWRCMYRTRLSSGSWGAWTSASNSGSLSWTDTGTNVNREFQIYAEGPAGFSGVASEYHHIGPAPIAGWQKDPCGFANKTTYYQLTLNATLSANTHTAEEIIPQYYIGTPASDLSPGSSSFTDGQSYAVADGNKNYALVVTTSDVIDEDECLWVRIKTTHDSVASLSTAVRKLTGVMKAPTCTVGVTTPTSSGFTVSISNLSINTSVPSAYTKVYLEKYSNPGEANYILLGTIANGTTSASISSSLNITGETGFAIQVQNVSADGKSMKSAYYTYSTDMPSAPTLSSVTATTVPGKVFLTWSTIWSSVTGFEIAWTDDQDNWMSNDEPETYTLEEIATAWYITGLDTGKMWYFKVRGVRVDSDDTTTYSPWSDEVSIDLASAPAVSMLYLSEQAITADGMVTAYWSYASTDGTGQIMGKIVEAEYDSTEGEWTYGDIVGATSTAQHVDIYAEDWGWDEGDRIYLSLQTGAESGGTSEYSVPVPLDIVAAPTVIISSTSLETTETLVEYFTGDGSTTTFTVSEDIYSITSVTVDGSTGSVSSYTDDTFTLSTAPDEDEVVIITYTSTSNSILDDMPLSVTTTVTDASTLTLAIERAESYPMIRPDGTETEGAAGETVFVKTYTVDSSATTSITLDELIGRLDDGAWYTLIASVRNDYSQTAEDTVRFKVHWSHQADTPSATFVTDDTNYIVRITPVAPSGYVSGDTCNIYRLSMDQPELIVENGEFGTEYVDPYPAFGELSGYKVVTITDTNDYITADNEFAEYDTLVEEDVYTQLDPGTIVIDFQGERVELPYNISLDNSWEKDFERTTYLGGHVTGDHNKAVTRDLSASLVIIAGEEEVLSSQLRTLARYAGVCHVRTPEGSSFEADVQVKETRSCDSAVIDYDLKIQKIDTVEPEGMTYADWSELQS